MTTPESAAGRQTKGKSLYAREVLQEGLSAYFGRPVRIVELECHSQEASSHPIDRLRVTLASGERLPVVLKRPQPGEKLYGNEREVLIYRLLLDGQRFGAPALYASVYDESRGQYWLFLEDLGERTLKRACREEWLIAIRWLAEMHATYLGREAELRALACLGEHGPDYYQTIAATARQYLEQAGARQARARLDALMKPFDALIAHLVRQPRTLLHGDIMAKNLMLQPGPRLRPIDWESAAIGPPAWDLARLLDGWGSDKPAFVAAYRAEFARQTTVPFDWRAFDAAFARCGILNVLWHLRWSVEACADAAFVNSLLDKLESRWARLDEEVGHG